MERYTAPGDRPPAGECLSRESKVVWLCLLMLLLINAHCHRALTKRGLCVSPDPLLALSIAHVQRIARPSLLPCAIPDGIMNQHTPSSSPSCVLTVASLCCRYTVYPHVYIKLAPIRDEFCRCRSSQQLIAQLCKLQYQKVSVMKRAPAMPAVGAS